MQRRLIVMRHAKSDWNTDAPNDHARPLNARGRRDAPRVAARLVELGWTPGHVLSSDSCRTRETHERMAEALGDLAETTFLRSLYHAGIDALRDAMLEVDDETSCAIALGHNPGWQHAVAWLCGESIEMTTANAALLECDEETWADALVRPRQWTLSDVVRPKEL